MRKKLLRLLFLIIPFLAGDRLTAQIQAISASDGEFENVTSTFLANGWTEAQPSDNKRWRVGTPAGSVAGGTKSAYMGNPGSNNGTNANLILHFYRDVFIPAGATNVLLNYYLKQTVTNNAADYFYVFTTTTAYTPLPNVMPGVGYTQRFVNTATAYPAFTVMPTVNLTALAGTTIRLVYTFNSDGIAPDANPAVDNVTLSYVPVPPPPCTGAPVGGSAIATPAVGNVSSAFNLNSPGATTGLGSTYQWQSSPDGIAWVNIPVATTLSYGATAVGVATTTYYRLIVTCTASGLSTASSVTTFVTTLVYCIPTITNASNIGEEIEFVSFVGSLNDVTNTSTSTGAYENFTNLSNRAIQEQGEGINVNVGALSRSTFWRAWVDWNTDGDFNDAGEAVYYTGLITSLTTTFGFTIPLTQPLGNYRIRIRTYSFSGSGYPSAFLNTEWCGSKRDGQTEDYLFTVVARCPSRITSVTGDTKCSGTSTTFTLCATATGGSAYLNWHDQQYGGTLLGTTPLTCFTTPAITATTTYWVTAGGAGCQSPGRVPVVATMRPAPVLNFSTGSPVTLCGDGTGTPPLSVTSTTETANLINENFEGGGTGVFAVSNTQSGGLTAAAINILQWTNQTSIHVPTTTLVWIPAISSGFGTNRFVISLRDTSIISGRWLNSMLTSPIVNSTSFTNLFLSFDIYYSHYLGDNINAIDDSVSVQASIDGGTSWNTLALYNADQGYGTRFASKLIVLPAAYLNRANLSIRFMYRGDWVDGAALDNIRLYGDRPITSNFIWNPVFPNTGGNMFTDAAFTIPYISGSAEPNIYIKPTAAQVLAETDLDFQATATLSNGCSASGTFTVKIGANTWTGAVSTNWNLAGNWCQSTLPSINSRVRIPNVPNKPVILTGNTGNARFLSIENGSSVTVDAGGTLQIKRDLNSLAGSAFTNNGTLNMIGSEAGQNQTFPGSGTIASMNNLTINNTSAGNQVLLNNALSIRGELRPTAGDLNLQGNAITLKSTNSATAFVTALGSTAAFTYGTGRFTVERFIGISARRWQFLAWPVQNENTLFSTWQESGNNSNGYGTFLTFPTGAVNGFDAFSFRTNIKYYNPAANMWNEAGLNATNNAFLTTASNTQGYMVFVRGNRTQTPLNGPAGTAATLRTRGMLNTGTLNSRVIVPANNFQSVSNPYACAINAENMLLNTSNISLQKGFTVWDPSIPGMWNLGGYVTLTQASGWNPSVVGHYTGPGDRFVRHGQAFMVQNATAFPVNLSIDEEDKHNAAPVNNDVFARVGRVTGDADEKTPRLHTQLNTLAGAPADGNYVSFHEAFLNGEDQYDFGKLDNLGENFGVRRTGKILVVDARRPVAINDTVFYNIGGMVTASYQLRFAPFNLSSTNLQGELIDKHLSTKTIISLTDTTYVKITFTANAASKAADRFYLIFRRQEGPLPDRFVSKTAYKNADGFTNHTEWKMADEQGINRYDLERSDDGINFKAFIQNIPATGAGIYSKRDMQPLKGFNFYRAKAYNQSGVVYYSGIAKVGDVGSISVYPNPVRDRERINVSFKDMAAGMYKLLLTNKAGQVISKQDVNIIGDRNVSFRLSGNVSPGTYHLQIAGKNNIVLFIKEIIIL